MGIYKYPRSYNYGIQKFDISVVGPIQLTQHFNLKEFRSKDGANEVKICPHLINDCLERLFAAMNAKSITITSGYRSINHSLSVGGKGATDNHHMGQAVDIKVKLKNNKYATAKQICTTAQKFWNGGIGIINSNSVHLDAGTKYWWDERNHEQIADFSKYRKW